MADSQKKSANLLDKTQFVGISATITQIPTGIHILTASNGYGAKIEIDVDSNTDYYISYIFRNIDNGADRIVVYAGAVQTTQLYTSTDIGGTFNTGDNTKINIWFYANFNRVAEVEYTNIMLVKGTTAPTTYQPYSSTGWVHSLHKLTTATETIQSGDTIYANGQPITTYMLKGNEEHTGTPSPQNPVMPNGVGNKTANLFDYEHTEGLLLGVYINQQGQTIENYSYNMSYFIEVQPNAEYTWNFGSTVSHNAPTAAFYDSNGDYISVATHGQGTYFSFTTPNNAAFVRVPIYISTKTAAMLNIGSTALPYEPYGFKIPISSAGQTIDIYIGDLPLLKSLDGTAVDEISNDTLTRRVDSDGSVLPTPTTTQITMPSIPTTDGANSITVDTTVQPSEFTATWTGWHDSSVKEYDGSDWQ